MSQVDRNLLFGLLALQNNFVDQSQLVAAFSTWVVDKSKSLDAILVDRGDIGEPLRVLLNHLVDKHIERNDKSVQGSLASLSSVSHVRQLLMSIDDSELKKSLAAIPVVEDPYKTYSIATYNGSGGLRFQIRRPLGRGGLGVVSVAHDRELNREVALKEIREDQSHNETMRRKFLVEAEITGNLEHPGIVPVYGLGTQADGRPYYAMRFIRGDNLGVHIKQFHSRVRQGLEPYDGSELRGLLRRFLDICDAIGYAHSRGVLHRDLKPGNVMLGRYGETLVVDWGLAKPKGASDQITSGSSDSIIDPKLSDYDATRLGSALGTPAYAPPEQMGGKHSAVSERSDVYGLGAILYELLCDSPPASGANIEEVVSRILRGDIPAPRKKMPIVPVALSAICMKALSLSPGDRYPSTTTLMKDVEAWLDDLPVQACPDGVVSNAGRVLRKNKGAAISATIGVFALAIVSGLYAWVANGLRSTAETEKGIAIVERQTAIEERNEAKKQRERADRHFLQARQSVDRFLTNVSQDPQLALDGFQNLRKRLLADALEYYEKFRSENQSDESFWQEMLEANRRVAMICESLGQYEEGLRAYEQASSDLEKRLKLDSSTQLRLDWAENELLRSRLLSSLGKDTDANSVAIAVNEYLKRQTFDRSELQRYNRIFASSYDQIAKLANRRIDRPEAARAIAESILLRETDAAENPSPATAMALANSRIISIRALAEQRNFEVAISVYQSVLSDLEKLGDQVDGTSLLAERADVSHLLAVAYGGRSEIALAQEYFQKAVELREELVARTSVLSFQMDLAKSFSDLSEVLKIADKKEESEVMWARSLQLSETLARYHRQLPEVQTQFAESLLRKGTALNDVALLQKSESVLKPLIENKSARKSSLLLLANVYDATAKAHAKAEDLNEAVKSQRQSFEIIESLVQEFPNEFQYRRALAASALKAGRRQLDAPDFVGAVKSYEKAVAMYRELVTAKANEDDTRFQFATALLYAGKANAKLKELDTANDFLVESLQEINRLRPTTNPAAVSKIRDSILALQQVIMLEKQDFKASAMLAIQHAALTPSDPVAALNAAKLVASIAEQIPGDDARLAADREFCIAMCFEELVRLQKLGYSESAKIKESKEFLFLKDDSRFAEIVAAMENR